MSAVAKIGTAVKSPRLSALAQLVAIYRQNGITSTRRLVELTGYSDRQIWRAKAELESQSERTQVKAGAAQPTQPTDGGACRSGVRVGADRGAGRDPEPGRAIPGTNIITLTRASPTPDAGVSVAGVRGADADVSADPDAGVRVAASSSPLKKGLPRTPSKEIHPSPSRLAETDSSPTAVGASSKQAARERFDSGQQAPPAGNPEEAIEELVGKSRAEELVRRYGRRILTDAYHELRSRLDAGKTYSRPGVILGLICGDLARRAAEMPWGAIDLGNGQYVSRW